MTAGYPELALGDVLLAPFVGQAAAALLLFALLRPFLSRLPLERLFANPPAVELCLFVLLTALLVFSS